MTLLVDANALYVQADADDPEHRIVADILRRERGPLITSEVVVAEADYLILDRLGIETELRFLRDLAGGTFTVECLTREDIGTALGLAERYRDLELGLADASLIVLAQRHRTERILTFDHRAFRNVTPLQGGTFTVLPADG